MAIRGFVFVCLVCREMRFRVIGEMAGDVGVVGGEGGIYGLLYLRRLKAGIQIFVDERRDSF